MKILVATDGSKFSLRAFKQALQLSRELNTPAQITLISVQEDTAFAHATHFVGKKAVDDYLADLAQADLKAALAAAGKAGVTVSTLVKVGHPVQQITEAAAKGKFDLLVVGAKGRGMLQDLLMGSVATRVAELSKVPVLLVK